MAKAANNKIKNFLHSPARVAIVGAAGVLLLVGGTVVGAKQSKPGDPLYNVGRAVEEVQLAFSFTDAMKESTHRSIAKERLEEIKALFAEKNINAAGIAVALSNFEEQRTDAIDLANKVSDDHAAEVEDELNSYESEIDALFEARQADLENQRETLKSLYEQAKKAGDAALAAQLKEQIETFQNHLKELEAKREESKQQQEQFVDSLEKKNGTDDSSNETENETENEDEAVKQKEEALSEAVKQEVEAQNEAAKRLEEQIKEAQERQAEILKEQQEKAREAAEKAAEDQQEQEDN